MLNNTKQTTLTNDILNMITAIDVDQLQVTNDITLLTRWGSLTDLHNIMIT